MIFCRSEQFRFDGVLSLYGVHAQYILGPTVQIYLPAQVCAKIFPAVSVHDTFSAPKASIFVQKSQIKSDVKK
jgi:hypothetical protein